MTVFLCENDHSQLPLSTLKTDNAGQATLPDLSFSTLVLYHPDHAIGVHEWADGFTRVTLNDRPHFFCEAQGLSPEETELHEILVSVGYDFDEYPLLGMLRRHAAGDFGRTFAASAGTTVEVVAPCDIQATVRAIARCRPASKESKVVPAGSLSTIVDAPLAGKVIALQFPVRLPVGYGNPRLVGSVTFPVEAELSVRLEGPMVPVDAGVLPFGQSQREYAVRGDRKLDEVVQTLAYGTYAVCLAARGFGSYTLDTVHYSGQETIPFSEVSQLRNVEIVVPELPSSDKQASLVIYDSDGRVVSGCSMDARDGGSHSFLLPLDADLSIVIDEWGGYHMIPRFSLRPAQAGTRLAAGPWQRAWSCTVDTSQFHRGRRDPLWIVVRPPTSETYTTPAFAPGGKVGLRLTEGRHALELCDPNGTLSQTVLDVPRDVGTLTVR
ncbi:MAG: hypothetical protein AB7O97_21205 [Planctomycetota bacterium]